MLRNSFDLIIFFSLKIVQYSFAYIPLKDLCIGLEVSLRSSTTSQNSAELNLHSKPRVIKTRESRIHSSNSTSLANMVNRLVLRPRRSTKRTKALRSRSREYDALLVISVLALLYVAHVSRILPSLSDITGSSGDIGYGIYNIYSSSGNSDAASWDRIPTNESRDRYERFRKKNATIMNRKTGELMPQPCVVYRGVSGLGHRLLRMSGTYHTSWIQQLPNLYSSWGYECGENKDGNPDIFDNVFGKGLLVTESKANAQGPIAESTIEIQGNV
jgi:hypothetical protein